MTDTITLPRSVVEQALECLEDNTSYDFSGNPYEEGDELMQAAAAKLRAALEQDHHEQHLNMVHSGWRLVPVEPTIPMLHRADGLTCIDFAALGEEGAFDLDELKEIYRAMLAAAPQPPAPGCKATKRGDHVVCDDCKSAWDANDKNPPACVPAPPAVEQPQAEQPAMTPIAQRKLEDLMASGYTISGYSVYHERKHQHGFVTGAGLVGWWKPDGVEYPQPKVEQEPAAVVTGFYGGFPTIRPLEPAAVLPAGMALYAHPQPPRQPMPNLMMDLGWELHGSNDPYQSWCMAVEWTERAHGITGGKE